MLLQTKTYTLEDYPKFDERTGERGGFEFSDGLIWDKYAGKPIEESLLDYILSDNFEEENLPLFDMPTQNHDDIVTYLQLLLNNILLTKGYITYSQKTAIPRTNKPKGFREPDLVVVSKKLQQRNDFHQVTNPTMLVEVLSKSTKTIDLTDKLEEYQHIESVQTYMIAWQDEPKVIIYSRQAVNIWEERIYEGINQIAFLPFFEIEIPLKNIYEGVVF